MMKNDEARSIIFHDKDRPTDSVLVYFEVIGTWAYDSGSDFYFWNVDVAAHYSILPQSVAGRVVNNDLLVQALCMDNRTNSGFFQTKFTEVDFNPIMAMYNALQEVRFGFHGEEIRKAICAHEEQFPFHWSWWVKVAARLFGYKLP